MANIKHCRFNEVDLVSPYNQDKCLIWRWAHSPERISLGYSEVSRPTNKIKVGTLHEIIARIYKDEGIRLTLPRVVELLDGNNWKTSKDVYYLLWYEVDRLKGIKDVIYER